MFVEVDAAMRMSLVCCALLLTGCFFNLERGVLLEERVRQLTQENETLQLEVKESQARVSQALEQTEQWARQSGADIGVQMQRSVEDIAQLRGILELLEHRIQELEAAQTALHAKTQSWTATPAPDTAGASGATAPRQAAKPDEPKAFLKYAQEVLEQKDIEEAQALFNEFLRRWPKDSAAGEVHFKLGETYFEKKHWREALYEYAKVIQEFPKTASAPLTYLRSHECFKQLKKLPESKLALQELVRVHPKSAEAKKAAELLKSLEESEKKESDRKAQTKTPTPTKTTTPAKAPAPAPTKAKTQR